MADHSALGRAMAMVADLRERCPWDRVQTRATLRPYLVEEVLELDYALGEADSDAIREEVSDLLLHLAWQLVLAQESGEFTADDVAGDLERKMKRRHPHLFDLGPREQWETLKRKEKGRSVLAGLPPLPALLMAYRLQERAASVGFDWPDSAGPVAKVREELAELIEAGGRADGPPGGPPAPELVEELGDLLFAVVNLSRKLGVAPDNALQAANGKFKQRFSKLEQAAAERGIDVHTAGLAVLDQIWNEVKRREP